MTTKLTPAILKQMRVSIDEALREVAKAYDLEELKAGNATYDPDGANFTFKLKGMKAGGVTPEASAYLANQTMLDLPALGTLFEHEGREREVS